MTDEPILAISASADFYPGLRDGEAIEDYDGDTIEWTFSLPSGKRVGPGVYSLELIIKHKVEEGLGNPVLGELTHRRSGDLL